MLNERPYVGLRNFKQDEGHLFFGRDEQIDQLIALLKDWHFIAVVGNSGCGKSSLVRAGLLYSLEKGFYSGYQWKIVKSHRAFRNNPFANLCDSLKSKGLISEDFSEEKLKYSEAIHDILYDNPLPEKTQLLIFVDQFEELFHYHDHEEAKLFVNLLLNCCQHPNVHVVITMRADFLGECAHFPGFVEAVTSGGFVVPYLTQKQLRDAIESPAKLYQGKVDEKLTQRLVEEMAVSPNHLPLLQYALMSMWDRIARTKKDKKETGITLTEDIYNNLIESEVESVRENRKRQNKKQTKWCKFLQYRWIYPLVPQRILDHFNCVIPSNEEKLEQRNLEIVLSYNANRIYRGLQSENHRRIAEILFRNLTERNKWKGINTKRWVELNEILEQVNAHFSNLDKDNIKEAILQVTNAFRKEGRNFIIPSSSRIPNKELTFDTKITITHENLINGWNLFNEWIEKRELEIVRQYLNIRHKATNWKDNGKIVTSLARGLELRNYYEWWKRERLSKAWAKRYDRDNGDKFELTEEFLKASNYHERLRRGQGALLIILLSSLLGFIYPYYQYLESKSMLESIRANEAQLAQGISDLQRENYQAAKQSIKKALDASATMPISYQHTVKLLAGLDDIFGGKEQTVRNFKVPLQAIAANSAGTLLGIVGEKGTVALLNTKDNSQQLLKGHTGIVNSVAIEPQGHWMVTGGKDKRIIRWSLPEGTEIKSWDAPDEIRAVAISPDGKYIATGGKDSVITLWIADTEEKVTSFTGHLDAISALAFDKTGQQLASASYDNTARLWQIETKLYKVLKGHANKVQKLAFSPDNQLLATTSSDKTIRLWDVNSGNAKDVFLGHQDIVFGVDFTSDGRYLVSSSFDRTVRLWDIASGVTVRVLQGHTAMVTNLVVQDKQILTVSADHTVKQWDATLPLQHHINLPDAAMSTAIAPNGQHVAVGFNDGTVRLYHLPDTQLVWENDIQEKHDKAVRRLAWSSDTQWLASAGSNHTIKLWRATDGKLERTLSGHQDGVHQDGVSAVVFSPDNRFLVSTSYDGQIGVFKLGTTTFAPKNSLDKKEELNSVAFNSEGTKLLVASDHNVHLFNFNKQSGELTLQKSYPETDRDVITWAAFGSGGGRYASVGRDGLAKVYATIGSGNPQNILAGHQTTILRAEFTPDNRQLVTVSGDATVRFWDLEGNRELFTLNLPTNSGKPVPLWDFDFRCADQGHGNCWVAVPLTKGKLALYELGKIY